MGRLWGTISLKSDNDKQTHAVVNMKSPMRSLATSFVVFLLYGTLVTSHRMPTFEDNAVVTLVTGHKSGYAYGAVALGESLRMHGSRMRRIAMVTADVDQESRQLIESLWDLVEVEPIYCRDRSAHLPAGVLPSTKDGYAEGLQQDMKRFETTCTKFRAWTFTEFDRILFMDSDLVVLENVDDALYGYSNASFVAAPECFPPDTINSGFMVFTPSVETFEFLVASNENGGSAEGGDQGIYSVYLCPNWVFSDRYDEDCGKLPWKFNVEAQYYLLYKNYLALYEMEGIRVIHYINDGKPWKTLFFDYNIQTMSRTSMIDQLSADSYIESHMYWRYLFLRATGLSPPKKSIYYNEWNDVTARKGAFKSISLPLFAGDKLERELERKATIVGNDGDRLSDDPKLTTALRRKKKRSRRNLDRDSARASGRTRKRISEGSQKKTKKKK